MVLLTVPAELGVVGRTGSEGRVLLALFRLVGLERWRRYRRGGDITQSLCRSFRELSRLLRGSSPLCWYHRV
jgi:hypothetical protein